MKLWITFLFLSALSDIVAALIGGVYFLRLREPLARRIAFLLFAISLYALSVFYWHQHNPTPAQQVGPAVVYWIGRIVRTAAVWALVLYSPKAKEDP